MKTQHTNESVLRGRWVECFHPDSPGTRLRVWRPWWKRKSPEFASLSELRRAWRRDLGRWEPIDKVYYAIPPTTGIQVTPRSISKAQAQAIAKKLSSMPANKITHLAPGNMAAEPEMGFNRKDESAQGQAQDQS